MYLMTENWTARNLNAYRRPIGLSKRTERINGILAQSHMELHASKDTKGWRWLLIRIFGKAAKLPSTTNNRLATVPRAGVCKQLEWMIQNPAARNVQNIKAALQGVKQLRALLTKNPDHVEQLDALTSLFEAVRRGTEFHFPFNSESRGLALMLLSPDLNRHDSHNIPKAVCDWMEAQKLFPNDRYIDAFARRKTDMAIAGQSSDVLLMRYDVVNQDANPMSQMLEIINKAESVAGVA